MSSRASLNYIRRQKYETYAIAKRKSLHTSPIIRHSSGFKSNSEIDDKKKSLLGFPTTSALAFELYSKPLMKAPL